MIHGPCEGQNANAPCLNDNGVCGVKYHMDYLDQTIMGHHIEGRVITREYPRRVEVGL